MTSVSPHEGSEARASRGTDKNRFYCINKISGVESQLQSLPVLKLRPMNTKGQLGMLTAASSSCPSLRAPVIHLYHGLRVHLSAHILYTNMHMHTSTRTHACRQSTYTNKVVRNKYFKNMLANIRITVMAI